MNSLSLFFFFPTHTNTYITKKTNMTFTLEPIIPTKEQSGVDFGAIVTDLDLETITRKIIYA